MADQNFRVKRGLEVGIGKTILYADPGGDVGINSTAPTATLDVNGTLNVSGISTFGGNVNLGDDDRLRFGAGQDLQIYHNSSNNNSIINESGPGNLIIGADNNIEIKNTSGTEFKAKFITDGAVELYYNNSKKFETLNSGVKATGIIDLTSELNFTGANNKYIDFYTDNDSGSTYAANLRLVNDASNSFHDAVRMVRGGAVELYYDNSLKFETTNTGIEVFNGASTSATIAGPDEIIIDPATVGDNTGSVRIKGDLFVDGTQTIINSSTIELADFIVGIASTATTDSLADGAGIQIGPDNTFLYEYNGGTNPSLKSSENLNVASGKHYQIGETEVLNATTLGSGVVNSSLTSVGTLTGLTVSGDVSIADKIVHTGDTNTAIRFPSNDTFTIETAGSERLRVTSSGQTKVTGADDQDNFIVDANQTQFVIHQDSTDGEVSIRAQDGSGNNFTKYMTFFIEGGSGPTERLRITSDGKFGINTISPQTKFVVSENGGAGFEVNPDLSSSVTLTAFDRGAANDWYDMRFRANELVFSPRGTERMRITSGGDVGIGVTNPAAKLDVAGDIIYNNNAIIAGSSGSTNIDHFWHNDATTYGQGGVWNFVSDSTYKANGNSAIRAGAFANMNDTGTASQKLQITGGAYVSGDVGIGLTNPSQELDVAGDIGVSGSVVFDNTTASIDPWLVQQATSGQLNFTISGTGGPEMQLSADGSSNTTAQLEVGGSRVLTVADEGSGNGLDADTVDGIEAANFLRSDQSDTMNGVLTVGGSSVSGGEGGELQLTYSPNTTLSGSTLNIDLQTNVFRVFEGGGNNRGAFLDLANCDNSVGSEILHSGSTAQTKTGQITLEQNSTSTTNFSLHIRNQQSAPAQIKFSNNLTNQNGYFYYRHEDASSNSAANSFHFNSDQTSTAIIIDQTAGNSGFYVGTNRCLTTADEGSGNGIDADTLDGQEGSYYLNTTTTFGGDVSGTYNAIVVANDSHTHAFDNLTAKTSGTGNYSTTGYLEAGRGSGSIALTPNDGYGNANVAFNHRSGTPDVTGKAGRIEVNVDSTSGDATMSFELGNATSGVAASINQILQLSSGTSTWSNNAGLTFNNIPAFNGGASGSTSPFTVDSTTKVTNLNADLLDDLSSGSFLRSDVDDTASGVITFSDDVSIADKIVHTGDTDTAIRFPTSDTFTVETLGLERLRINSNGNIGIGTNVPQTKLHVQGGDIQVGRIEVNGLETILNDSALRFHRDTNPAYIDQLGTGPLRFRYGASNTTWMTMEGSSGNIGIATNSPSQTLDVNGNARFRGAIYDGGNGAGTSGQILSSTGTGVDWIDQSSLSVGDANTLDGLDSTQFLRSDTYDEYAGDTSGRRIRFKCVEGQNAASTSGNLFSLEVYQNSDTTNSDAAMTFHISNRYATYFGLDRETNDLFVGGWSKGANKYKIWHAGNDGTGSGLDADTLDGLDSTQFLRSDAADTASGQITFSDGIVLPTTGDGIKFGPGTASNDDAHIEWLGGSNAGHLRFSTSDDNGSEYMQFGDYDTTNKGGTFTEWMQISRSTFTRSGNTIWHAGNDGSGSGLDADTLDTLDSTSFLRSDADDTASGKLTFTASGTDTLTINKSSTTNYGGITFAEGGDDRFLLYVVNQADGSLNLQSRKNGTDFRSVWSVNQSTGVQNFGIAPTILNNVVWHAGNDGSGSGLDADLLDGIDSGSFVRTILTDDDITSRMNSGFYESSTVTTAEGWPVTSNSWYHLISSTHSNTSNYYSMQIAGDFFSQDNFYIRSTNNSGTTAWSEIWTSSSDGSGSGLDADTLDGQEGSYYTNASNINAGTINDAYLPATISSDITGNAATATSATTATTATTSTNVTVADESTDTTCFPLFVTAATGDLPPKSGSNLTFDSANGILESTQFHSTFSTATSLTDGAIVLDATGGAIVMDNSGQRRISWNDGGGNFQIRSGHYYNSGEKYVVTGDGAANIQMSTDAQNAQIRFEVANTGTAGNAVSWNKYVQLTTTSFNVDGNEVLDAATTFGGDVSGTYNAIVVANDSHTHDTRYFTETESDARFLRSDVADTHSGTGGLTFNDGLLIDGGPGTIAGATFDNGWLRIGNSTTGITMDSNELYFAGAGLIGALSGGSISFTARPAFNGGTSGSTSPFTVDSTQVVTNLNADLLDGYQADTAVTGSTVAARTSAGDVQCRLVRQTFGNQSTISGGLVYRINDGSDNYLRICNNLPNIRSYLGLSAVDNSSNTLTFAGTVTAAKFWERNANPDYQTSGFSADAGKVRATGASGAGAIIGNTNTSGYNTMISFVGGSTSAGYGAIEANSSNGPRFVAPSDRRMKKDIRPAESQFDLFKQLQFYNYTMDYPELIEDPICDCLGMIADEVQQVMPELVTGEPNAVDEDGNPEYQSVGYTGLVPHSLAAIKELILKVEELQARLDAAGL